MICIVVCVCKVCVSPHDDAKYYVPTVPVWQQCLCTVYVLVSTNWFRSCSSVPLLPAKSWIFCIFKHPESPGKWVWSLWVLEIKAWCLENSRNLLAVRIKDHAVMHVRMRAHWNNDSEYRNTRQTVSFQPVMAIPQWVVLWDCIYSVSNCCLSLYLNSYFIFKHCLVEWWGAGMVIYLQRCADVHISQSLPLPLTVSCISKILTGFTFLVLAYPGSPGQRAVKRVCVSGYSKML